MVWKLPGLYLLAIYVIHMHSQWCFFQVRDKGFLFLGRPTSLNTIWETSTVCSKKHSFPHSLLNKLLVIDGNSTKLISCLRNWSCVQDVWECWEEGCARCSGETQKEDPCFRTTWWGSAWRAPLDSGGSSSDTQGYLSMCCSRIKLLKIAKVLICLIVLTQLCLFVVNSGSLFDLANTKIFR